MTENESLRVRKTIRPMRFLFIVSNEDFNAIKQVVRINTALWGGYFNPITVSEQRKDNILSLYKASHSDVIVNFSAQPIVSSSLGLGDYQVIQKDGFDGLLENENGKFRFRYGCDVRPLMRFYWKEEGRFQIVSQSETTQHTYHYIESDDQLWADYALLEFGQYPNDLLYDYKSNYQKATNCTLLQIGASNLPDTRHKIQLTPLLFSLEETDYFYYGARSRFFDEKMIYIGDLNNYADWIEFWNIRCFYSRATFIHWENAPLFENHLRNMTETQKSRKEGNTFSDIIVQKASSLTPALFSETLDKVRSFISGRIVAGYELPPIGISFQSRKHRPHGPLPIESPIAKSYEQEDLGYLSGNELEFKVPLPEFLMPYTGEGRSWCTTINGWGTQSNDFWLRIPNIGKIEETLRKNFFFFEGFRISPRENIVLFPRRYSSMPLDIVSIRFPSHLDVLKSIFAGNKIEVTDYSEKGRYAIAIEDAAAQGKWYAADILLDRGVQAILNRLSKNNGETYLPRHELEKIAGENSLSIKEKEATPAQLINVLIDRKILRIGLELKCSKCYSQDWYHISQFSEVFKCLHCFTEQSLPIIDNKEWRYKSSGLFSSPSVGYGSLPVICLNLFLQRRYHSDLKSFYSFNIKFPDGELGEVDSAFVRHAIQDEPELLVCECKSGEAYQKDFDKLVKLCTLIPGTVACITTWKDVFSEEEKLLAKKVWEKGVELILLTRLDIESKGIAFEGVSDEYKYISDFVDLAHATREKYLK